MIKNSLLILMIGLFHSCSTLNRSVLTGALAGGTLGASGGAVFSPSPNDRDKNTYIFGVLGSVLGAGIAYLLWDDPKPQKIQTPMIMDDHLPPKAELPLFDFAPELENVRPEVTFRPLSKFEVPVADLPPELQGKVKKQFIIEYEADARTINIGNRTIEISPFKAWEHVYEH